MLYIHPGDCADCAACAACERACPVEAIFCDDNVPEQWSRSTAENARLSGRLAQRRREDRPAAV